MFAHIEDTDLAGVSQSHVADYKLYFTAHGLKFIGTLVLTVGAGAQCYYYFIAFIAASGTERIGKQIG